MFVRLMFVVYCMLFCLVGVDLFWFFCLLFGGLFDLLVLLCFVLLCYNSVV